HHLQIKETKTAIVLSVYTIIYLGSIYAINILGSSAALWLVQFIIPLILLKILEQPLSGINFLWKKIFKDFKYVLAVSAILVPFLIFNVRDSEQIIQLFKSWKIVLYFPVSILYMLLIVAFWEEFFFRGIVLNSVLKLTNNNAVAIFISAFLFGIYHLPMRYLNLKSPYYGDLTLSFAATISEQFLMGLFLGIIVNKSKNIWHGVWLHAILNGVSFIYQLSTMLKV
ncbi:MAG: lysostaphin resistance A-like protein, partial [Sphingobacteriales bacterium]